MINIYFLSENYIQVYFIYFKFYNCANFSNFFDLVIFICALCNIIENSLFLQWIFSEWDSCFHSSWSKSSLSSNSRIKLFNFQKLSDCIFFDNHLSDSVILLNFKINVWQIEKKNFDFTSVIRVNNSCSHIYHIFGSESRSGCYSSIVANWNGHWDSSWNECFASCWNNFILICMDIITSCLFWALTWQRCIFLKLFNLKSWQILSDLFTLIFHCWQ